MLGPLPIPTIYGHYLPMGRVGPHAFFSILTTYLPLLSTCLPHYLYLMPVLDCLLCHYSTPWYACQWTYVTRPSHARFLRDGRPPDLRLITTCLATATCLTPAPPHYACYLPIRACSTRYHRRPTVGVACLTYIYRYALPEGRKCIRRDAATPATPAQRPILPGPTLCHSSHLPVVNRRGTRGEWCVGGGTVV